jgi:ketosteroid isomerase-like protein
LLRERQSKYIPVSVLQYSLRKKEAILMQRTLVACAVLLLAAAAVYAKQSAHAPEQQKTPAQRKMSGRDAKTVAAVRAVLEAQVAAWNRGDIDGYMDGYARSDETLFISGDSMTRGWQTVLERYKKGYDTRAKMGQLTFSDLEIKPVSKDAAIAQGRWQLTREKDTPHGRFTLVFRLTKDGWRIVHDHTSSA